MTREQEIKNINRGDRLELAKGFYTSSGDLAILSSDDHPWIREAVAQNCNTSSDTLDSLARDVKYTVREAVAKNINTSLKGLCLLWEKEKIEQDVYVLYFLYKNDKTPDWLKAAIETRSPSVKHYKHSSMV